MDQLPSISAQHFRDACGQLETSLKACAVDCTLISQDDNTWFILRQSVKDQKPNKSRSHYAVPDEEIFEEPVNDPDRLDVLPLNPWTVPVEYHILLSPTYQVPVLYFQSLYPLDDDEPTSVAVILEHLGSIYCCGSGW